MDNLHFWIQRPIKIYVTILKQIKDNVAKTTKWREKWIDKIEVYGFNSTLCSICSVLQGNEGHNLQTHAIYEDFEKIVNRIS